MPRSSVSWIAPLFCGLWLVAGCTPTYPKCNKDKDCHEKEFCVNGQCQQCRKDSDCADGQACNKGRCETKEIACAEDSQCPSGIPCVAGVCKKCTSDSECGEGGKCNKGNCLRAPGKATATGEDVTSGKGCNLEPVYFDFNEYALSTDATAAIDKNADCIKKTGGAKAVQLTGRTDPRGTEEYNLALSDHRAQTVKDRMMRMGVDGSRLKTIAKGELDASGTDESGWARDRRVDVNF